MNQKNTLVLHTIHSLKASAGGPSRTVPSLCEAVARTGAFRVFLLTTSSSCNQNLLPASDLVTTIELPFSGHPWGVALQRKFLSEVLKIHRDYKIDLIHDHGQWLATNRAAASGAYQLGIPRVVSPRGMLSPWALGYRKWLKRLFWNFHAYRDIQSASRIHATSELEKIELRELGLKPLIDVIPNGIKISSPDFGGLKAYQPKIALFLSRIHPKKGLENLLIAWSRLRPVGWKAIIAGPDEGGHLSYLQRKSSELKLSEDFDFVGSVEGEAKWDLYRQASLFVLPSHSENFGVVVGEALAAGVPVITTRATPWELLETARCGWWIEPNADALETALQSAFQRTSEELAAMGQRGRTAVMAEFSWDRIGEMTAQSYLQILGDLKRPNGETK